MEDVIMKQMIQVPYEYLTAADVDLLKDSARTGRMWETTRWGSFGPNGDEPRKKRMLNDLTTDHLEAILITQPHITPMTRAIILELLKLRYNQ